MYFAGQPAPLDLGVTGLAHTCSTPAATAGYYLVSPGDDGAFGRAEGLVPPSPAAEILEELRLDGFLLEQLTGRRSSPARPGIGSAQGAEQQHCPEQQELYVMLPLDTVNSDGVFRYATSQWFSQALQLLASSGVHGVAVDVWWGAVERSPGEYHWQGYRQLFEMVRAKGLRVQAVLSFHACGGNVGDRVQIPLPAWVLAAGQQDPDIFFTDRPRPNGLGQRNKEYLSIWADDEPVLFGRSPMTCYVAFMEAFRTAFEADMGGLISEVVVGMGPCGELRYPSYLEAHGWRFPGVGEFQCYDRRALASLAQAAREAGRPDWGFAGPHDSGSYCSLPEETGFFASVGGSWDSEYGHFFLSWYSRCLLTHGEKLMAAAARVFGPHQRPGGPGLGEVLRRLLQRLQGLLSPGGGGGEPGSSGSGTATPSAASGGSTGTPLPATPTAAAGDDEGACTSGGGSPCERPLAGGLAAAASASGGAAAGVASLAVQPPPTTPFELVTQLLQLYTGNPGGGVAASSSGGSGGGGGAASEAPVTPLGVIGSGSLDSYDSDGLRTAASAGACVADPSCDVRGGGAPLHSSALSLAALSEPTSVFLTATAGVVSGSGGDRARSAYAAARRLDLRLGAAQRIASSGTLSESAADPASSALRSSWVHLGGTMSLGSLSADCVSGGSAAPVGGSEVQLDELDAASTCGASAAAQLPPAPRAVATRAAVAAPSAMASAASSAASSGAQRPALAGPAQRPSAAAAAAAAAAALASDGAWASSPRRRGLLEAVVAGLAAAQVGVAEALGAEAAPACEAAAHARRPLTLSMKVAGVHWWFRSRSHAGELTAGYYNTAHRDGYRAILDLAARHGACVTLTCVEMSDAQHPPCAQCGPEGLLRQVRAQAALLGVALSGENALPIFSSDGVDVVALDRIVRNTRPWAPPPPGTGYGGGGGGGGGGLYPTHHGGWHSAGADAADPLGGGGGGAAAGSMRRTATMIGGMHSWAEDGGGGGGPWSGAAPGRMLSGSGRSSSMPVCRAVSGGGDAGGFGPAYVAAAAAAGGAFASEAPAPGGGGATAAAAAVRGGGATPPPPSPPSTMRAFTFLRLGPEILQPEYQAPWVHFVSRMRHA